MRKKIFFSFCIATLVFQLTNSQASFSNEIGAYAGPVALYSDYGQRQNFDTNIGNVGFTIGLTHYMNFSYTNGYNIYSPLNYVKDHFKIRNEISYTKVNLQHFGDFVAPDRTSLFAQQLRGMRGESSIFSLGSSVEFYPLSIKNFESNGYKISPHIGAGIHYSFYTPRAFSTLGVLGDPAVTPEKFQGAFTNESGSAISLVGSIGGRYKISPLEDLLLQAKWQFFFSDFVDGLSPDENRFPENRANDWLFSIQIGYIFYLEK
ncbi:glutamate dehydrogenase [Flavobacteriaceae bacterium R38]|nr:glutamate dehydrogenase [Flavobacteriaceae bacterium R38]